MKNTLNLLAAIVLLNSFVFSLGAAGLAKNGDPTMSEQRAVEKVLDHYLDCRKKLDFECCADLLTSYYLQRFSIKNKMSYVDFYKGAETLYHEAKLIHFNKVSESLIDVTVESYSEEPGVLSKDIEVYRLKNLSGSWKIDDFSINESKIVKEIGADGKWKDVKQE